MAARLHVPSRSRRAAWMTPGTEFQWTRLRLRFDAYRQTVAAQSLAQQVQGFLSTLPASSQSAARCALKRHLGKGALDWAELEVARHRRDETRLRASVLDADQRAKVREVAQWPREVALIECLFSMRRAEVADLTWGAINLSDGSVRIRRGKGGRPGLTLLTDGAREALAALFLEAGEPADERNVFIVPPGVGHPKRVGDPYTPGGLGRWVQRILTRAGCWSRGIGCAHRFRRTFATEYLRANREDLVGLMGLMRHQQINTTQKYVLFNPTDLADRMGRVKL